MAPHSAMNDFELSLSSTLDQGQSQPESQTGFGTADLTQWPLDWAMEDLPVLDLGSNSESQGLPVPVFGEPDSVSDGELNTLCDEYFNYAFPTYPFVSQERFTKTRVTGFRAHPVQSLTYAVALMGSTVSSKHAALVRPCYRLARKYIELCEQSDSEEDLVNLDLFQALLLVIRYELMSKNLVKAWMTLGRATRLSKMFQLHQMDSDTDRGSDVSLAPSQSDVIIEERRRSFWALYMLESYAITRTGWPSDLGSTKNLDVLLPCAGAMDSTFVSSPTPRLSDVDLQTKDSPMQLYSYAGCVVMVELAFRCFEHGRRLEVDPDGGGFWDSHYSLIKDMDLRTSILRPHLNANSIREDPLALSLHLNLSATEVYFHEVAISEVRRRNLPDALAAESRKRSTGAAFKIASAIRLHWSKQPSEYDMLSLQSTFVAWPVVMAMKALSRELLASEPKDQTSMAFANSLRLLLAALDRVEDADGYWHASAAGVASVLQSWDERLGFEL